MEPFQLLYSNDGIAGNLKWMLTSILLSLKKISTFNILKSLYITWYQFASGLVKNKKSKSSFMPSENLSAGCELLMQGARLANLTWVKEHLGFLETLMHRSYSTSMFPHMQFNLCMLCGRKGPSLKNWQKEKNATCWKLMFKSPGPYCAIDF